MPAFIEDVIPAVGALAPGTYTYQDVDATGVNVRFTVPAGWAWDGRTLRKDRVGAPLGAAIYFYGGGVEVYADPCHWTDQPPAPQSTRHAIDSLLAQPLREATVVSQRNVPALGPKQWAGTMVEVTVPEAVDFASCDAGQYRSWLHAKGARSHEGPGQRDLVWAIDVYGINGQSGGIILDAASFPSTEPDVVDEMNQVFDSIYVGHWG